MDSTHVAVAVGTGAGGTAAMGAVTTILTGFHGLDPSHASAWAWVVLNGIPAVAAGLGAGIVKFCAWKWPTKVS